MIEIRVHATAHEHVGRDGLLDVETRSDGPITHAFDLAGLRRIRSDRRRHAHVPALRESAFPTQIDAMELASERGLVGAVSVLLPEKS